MENIITDWPLICLLHEPHEPLIEAIIRYLAVPRFTDFILRLSPSVQPHQHVSCVSPSLQSRTSGLFTPPSKTPRARTGRRSNPPQNRRRGNHKDRQ